MNQKMKKDGFTLMEIIFVVILIAVLVGLFFPNIISNKDKANINAAVSNDAKLLSNAITQWKGSSSTSDGTYSNVSVDEIEPYLPPTMSIKDVGGTHYVSSSGLNGRILYIVDSDTASTAGDTFKIDADFSSLKNAQNLTGRTVSYGETTIGSTWKSISIRKTDTTIDYGSSKTDGKLTINKIKL